jgi:hypothetical protein
MGEYISLACQSKSWNTWRGSIYHWSLKVNSEIDRPLICTPLSCVSEFTLTDQWYILPRHMFQDLLWQASDIYSPIMCFGIYVERPVIYTPPSYVSGFTLRDQWYILPSHVFQDLLWHWSVNVNPETHDWVVYITGLSTWIPKHMTEEYISLVCQRKSRNTWRGSIYHWSVKVNPETHDGGVYITGLST